jgi:hypothetical protein
MTLREEILDALADDGESIETIKSWFKHVNVSFPDEEIINELTTMLKEKAITIAYPYDKKGSLSLDIKHIEDYWFELTLLGRSEQQHIKL